MLQRGDVVKWDRRKIVLPSRAPYVTGVVLRVARDGSWADIRYEIPEGERGELAIAWNITHRTQRVKTMYLRKEAVTDGATE
jgi:hypothetical protein